MSPWRTLPDSESHLKRTQRLGRLLFLLALLNGAAMCSPRGAGALPVRVQVGPCSIEAPPSLEAQANALAERARGILPRLERRLGVRPQAPFRIFLIPQGALDDREAALVDGLAPEWAAGYMVGSQRVGGVRVARAQRYPYGTVESVFAHEVTHLLLYDAVGERLPRWFNEGVATQEGRRWGVQDMVLHTSTLLTTSLPPLEQLNAAFHGSENDARVAYAASFAFVAWSETQYGPQFIPDLVRELAKTPFEQAWQRAAGLPFAESEQKWRGETLLRYRWIPIVAAGSMLWALLGLLAFVGGIRKKAKARATREAWAARERLDDARADQRDEGSL